MSLPVSPPSYPRATGQACGCDSVSSCLTPSAVLIVLLIGLLRADTNCQLPLDLVLAGILFSATCNLLGVAEAFLPWLNGGFGCAPFPVRPGAGCRLKSQRTECQPLRLTWHAMRLGVERAEQTGESPGSSLSCSVGKPGVGNGLADHGWTLVPLSSKGEETGPSRVPSPEISREILKMPTHLLM